MKRWLSPFERRQRWARVERWTIALALIYIVLWIIDPYLYRAFPDAEAKLPEGAPRRIYEPGAWGEFFRALGSLPLWLALSLSVILTARGRGTREEGGPTREDGIWLFFTPALAGLAAEALKILFGRDRPGLHEGHHVYRPFFRDGFFDARNLSLPSSHAAVAFGGACALIAIFPRTWPVALAAAAGCAWGRVYAGDHFLTDVFVGSLVGYGVARLLRPWAGGR